MTPIQRTTDYCISVIKDCSLSQFIYTWLHDSSFPLLLTAAEQIEAVQVWKVSHISTEVPEYIPRKILELNWEKKPLLCTEQQRNILLVKIN